MECSFSESVKDQNKEESNEEKSVEQRRRRAAHSRIGSFDQPNGVLSKVVVERWCYSSQLNGWIEKQQIGVLVEWVKHSELFVPKWIIACFEFDSSNFLRIYERIRSEQLLSKIQHVPNVETIQIGHQTLMKTSSIDRISLKEKQQTWCHQKASRDLEQMATFVGFDRFSRSILAQQFKIDST